MVGINFKYVILEYRGRGWLSNGGEGDKGFCVG
jgi:hypothetical protein